MDSELELGNVTLLLQPTMKFSNGSVLSLPSSSHSFWAFQSELSRLRWTTPRWTLLFDDCLQSWIFHRSSRNRSGQHGNSWVVHSPASLGLIRKDVRNVKWQYTRWKQLFVPFSQLFSSISFAWKRRIFALTNYRNRQDNHHKRCNLHFSPFWFLSDKSYSTMHRMWNCFVTLKLHSTK